jgi:hypothetical protein
MEGMEQQTLVVAVVVLDNHQQEMRLAAATAVPA